MQGERTVPFILPAHQAPKPLTARIFGCSPRSNNRERDLLKNDVSDGCAIIANEAIDLRELGTNEGSFVSTSELPTSNLLKLVVQIMKRERLKTDAISVHQYIFTTPNTSKTLSNFVQKFVKKPQKDRFLR
jgi:hypothetical protein